MCYFSLCLHYGPSGTYNLPLGAEELIILTRVLSMAPLHLPLYITFPLWPNGHDQHETQCVDINPKTSLKRLGGA